MKDKNNGKIKNQKNYINSINNRSIKLPSVRPGMPIDYVAPSKADVLGSYTGIPVDSWVPEQDADDL